ncbi:MAG TPA: NAD-dependent epimerase/dehydratase family protein [Nanoarchaeota archaeon]|nr:NAD-dependent epimerase/dehydratase family protein [Nanoarchaeota archaeon]HIH34053.1 NAD-dependent epimerase/dehydratase family protein [Nanoarchaeota archaeon]HIH51826.1 NAD-dependent epimerase/dehydratase family protein [Nanoarchaeota archaeon]HIH66260.1 NAD-dependent epimerase/dehydratase family protein [Nanoarchaeota archaeon]
MSSNYWSGKKVLVTGADGFMGSHLTERLLSFGADVSIFLRGSSTEGTRNFSVKNLKSSISKISNILEGDISSVDSIKLIRNNNPEIIFHLAAEAYVPKSFKQPILVKEVNLDGTLNVLEAAMKLSSIQGVVCTSSSEIYGTSNIAINEDHPLNPTSPYGASKAAADRFCFSYWNTYGLPIAIIRPFNTYGPRHTYDVIPKFITRALKNEPLTVHGDGSQTRDFTYVDDMIEAFLLMGSRKEAVGQAVNFGTGKDVSIREIAEKIVRYSNSSSKIEYIEKRTSEVQKLLCDPSKAKQLFSWEAKISIDDGLRKNIQWEIGDISKS